MNTVIAASGLGKAYRRTWALRDCTLAIPEGHVVGLVGPNGAGKTTLLRLATGMLTPTRGTITVLGQRPAAGPVQLARVGFVAQDTAVYARMTVADHLRLGARLHDPARGHRAAPGQHVCRRRARQLSRQQLPEPGHLLHCVAGPQPLRGAFPAQHRDHPAGARRHRPVLGSAADRPRAGDRDRCPGLEPVRHPDPVAGRQARRRRPGRHGRHRSAVPHADQTTPTPGPHGSQTAERRARYPGS